MNAVNCVNCWRGNSQVFYTPDELVQMLVLAGVFC